MKKTFIVFFILLCTPCYCPAQENSYIGSERCKDCHEDQYRNFIAFSKKAGSFESIKKMEHKLDPKEYHECFECHTTGYGKPGGFVSEARTPELKNPGCEVCHGPGLLHAESEDPELIRVEITVGACSSCHNAERVEAFDFKPLLLGGAH